MKGISIMGTEAHGIAGELGPASRGRDNKIGY